MIYLDSNIFIFAAIDGGELGGKARAIIDAVNRNQLEAMTSAITFDELVHIVRKNRDSSLAVKTGRAFLELNTLVIIDVNRRILDEALFLIEKYNFRPMDSIHLAAMRINRIDEILSEDSDFDKVKEIKRISLNKFKLKN